ncbi:hypothetical protein WDW86_05580 [Bdellovibrionota bacterium FG-2]
MLKKLVSVFFVGTIASSALADMNAPSEREKNDSTPIGAEISVSPENAEEYLLDYSAIAKQVEHLRAPDANENFVIKFHEENTKVDISTFDHHTITVPLSRISKIAPNWATGP